MALVVFLSRNAGKSLQFREVSWKTFVLEVWILTFCDSLVENARFGRLQFSVFANVSWKTLVLESFIRSSWKFSFSLLEKSLVWKTLVLQVFLLTFGDSLAQNVRFGGLHSQFWHKSRGKCSFWKASFSAFAKKASWKTLVLEGFTFSFLQQSRGKRSFWKASFSVIMEKVSWKTLALEV